MLTTQRHIGYIAGCPNGTNVPFLVASFDPSPVLVTCGGITETVQLTSIGSDVGGGNVAGYYGHGILRCSTLGKRESVSLTQDAVTESDCSVWPNSSATTRIKIHQGSCDNPPNVFGGNISGGYRHVTATVREALCPQYMVFADDFGYPSRMVVNDLLLNKAHTGIPSDTVLEHDYALSYFNCLGMFSDVRDENIKWGLDADRVYSIRNMAWLLQVGDWEFFNDAGFDAVALGDPRYTVARAVWDKLFGPLRPAVDIRSRDTTALHWGVTIGCVRIVAMDNVTRGSGGYINGTTAIATQFGNNQIDDCLDALNTNDPFKLLVINVGDKYMGAPATATEFQSGQQHPLFDHCLAEFQRLYTATGNTPKSIMDNPYTNGTLAVLNGWHGDTHRGQIFNNQAIAYAGNAAENWWSWFQGTINGCVNFGLQFDAVTNCVDGGLYRGTSVVYTQMSGDATHALHRYHTLDADVRGDLAVPVITCTMRDESRIVCRADFRIGSNQPQSRLAMF